MEKTKNKIRELRISKNLTQQQLADEIHVTKQAISKWEKGKSVPDIASVELLSSFFGVSADYLINDNIETADTETTTVILSKHLNKFNIALISLIALLLATVIALSVVVGILSNKNRPVDTVKVNGFEITYLSDETSEISEETKRILLKFNIYNSTDYSKTCMAENFALNNKYLYIDYVLPNKYTIAAHEELKLEILIRIKGATSFSDKTLVKLQQKTVTVKYAGQAIANIKW